MQSNHILCHVSSIMFGFLLGWSRPPPTHWIWCGNAHHYPTLQGYFFIHVTDYITLLRLLASKSCHLRQFLGCLSICPHVRTLHSCERELLKCLLLILSEFYKCLKALGALCLERSDWQTALSVLLYFCSHPSMIHYDYQHTECRTTELVNCAQGLWEKKIILRIMYKLVIALID